MRPTVLNHQDSRPSTGRSQLVHSVTVQAVAAKNLDEMIQHGITSESCLMRSQIAAKNWDEIIRNENPSTSSLRRSQSVRTVATKNQDEMTKQEIPSKSILKRSQSFRTPEENMVLKKKQEISKVSLKYSKLKSQSTGNLAQSNALQKAAPSSHVPPMTSVFRPATSFARRLSVFSDDVTCGSVLQENVILRMRVNKMEKNLLKLMGGLKEVIYNALFFNPISTKLPKT